MSRPAGLPELVQRHIVLLGRALELRVEAEELLEVGAEAWGQHLRRR